MNSPLSKPLLAGALVALFPVLLFADPGAPLPDGGSTAILVLCSLAGLTAAKRFLFRSRD